MSLTLSGAGTISGVNPAGVSSNQTGKVLQVVRYETGTYQTGSTGNFPPTSMSTAPTSSGGDQFMAVSITPVSATSTLFVQVNFILAANGAVNVGCGLFKDAASAPFATTWVLTTGAGYGMNVSFSGSVTAGSTASTSIKLRAGQAANTGYTVYMNGYSGSAYFGGLLTSSLTVTEIAV